MIGIVTPGVGGVVMAGIQCSSASIKVLGGERLEQRERLLLLEAEGGV